MYMTENRNKQLSGWLVSQPIEWLSDWLNVRLSGCLFSRMIERMIDRIGNQKYDRSNVQTIKCSNGQPVNHFNGWLYGYISGYPVGHPVCQMNNQPYV